MSPRELLGDVNVVSLSAGEAALDHLVVSTPDLGEQRVAELATACHALG